MLTYSPCDLDLNKILTLLQDIIFKTSCNITKYLLVSEQGLKLHIHVYLQLDKKSDMKSPNFFDLVTDIINEEGKPIVFHGNYQSCKKPLETIDYLLKNVTSKESKNLLFSKSLSSFIDMNGRFCSLDESMLLLAEQGKVAEALDLLRTEDIKRYLKDRFILESLLRKHYVLKLGFQTKFSLKDFEIPEDFQKVLLSDDVSKGKKTLVIVGKPGSGKTQKVCLF